MQLKKQLITNRLMRGELTKESKSKSSKDTKTERPLKLLIALEGHRTTLVAPCIYGFLRASGQTIGGSENLRIILINI